jgi:hypothetical protein
METSSWMDHLATLSPCFPRHRRNEVPAADSFSRGPQRCRTYNDADRDAAVLCIHGPAGWVTVDEIKAPQLQKDGLMMIGFARLAHAQLHNFWPGATTLWETWTGSRYQPTASVSASPFDWWAEWKLCRSLFHVISTATSCDAVEPHYVWLAERLVLPAPCRHSACRRHTRL